jgi:hypothetical protein
VINGQIVRDLAMFGGTFGNSLFTGLIAGLTSSGVLSVIFGFILQKKTAEIQNHVRAEFDRQNAIYLSRRKWKEAVLSELLGPMYMQLDRTRAQTHNQ